MLSAAALGRHGEYVVKRAVPEMMQQFPPQANEGRSQQREADSASAAPSGNCRADARESLR
jgi:hypothetical protein